MADDGGAVEDGARLLAGTISTPQPETIDSAVFTPNLNAPRN